MPGAATPNNSGPHHRESSDGVRPSGNSTTAALRRLRTHRPDLHERVLQNELTPHAAMVEAGFRRRPSALRSLVTAWRKASQLERVAFESWFHAWAATDAAIDAQREFDRRLDRDIDEALADAVVEDWFDLLDKYDPKAAESTAVEPRSAPPRRCHPRGSEGWRPSPREERVRAQLDRWRPQDVREFDEDRGVWINSTRWVRLEPGKRWKLNLRPNPDCPGYMIEEWTMVDETEPVDDEERASLELRRRGPTVEEFRERIRAVAKAPAKKA